jgi:hypothetical protein
VQRASDHIFNAQLRPAASSQVAHGWMFHAVRLATTAPFTADDYAKLRDPGPHTPTVPIKSQLETSNDHNDGAFTQASEFDGDLFHPSRKRSP